MVILRIASDLYYRLKLVARFRGLTIPQLLYAFLETIDDAEQDEIGLSNI